MFTLPVMHVPLSCIETAAIQFHIPEKLIIAVLLTEHGEVGQVHKNTNGTYDIGPMQINSSALPELKKYGITQNDIQYDACTNVGVGTWILSKKIAKRDSLLVGIGDYNSHTVQFNQNYYTKVRINYTKTNTVLV